MPHTHKTKVCAKCGKSEDRHWASHWMKRHPGFEPRELVPDNQPENPFDQDWIYLINDMKVREKY